MVLVWGFVYGMPGGLVNVDATDWGALVSAGDMASRRELVAIFVRGLDLLSSSGGFEAGHWNFGLAEPLSCCYCSMPWFAVCLVVVLIPKVMQIGNKS